MSLGIGAVIHTLSGRSPKKPNDYYGKKIKTAELIENEILISFEDGLKIKIWDDGQSCCESRYITTDDDVKDLIGQILISINAKDGPDIERDYGYHEQVFVEIQGNNSSITFCTHNENNGYYGGFVLSCDEVLV